MDTSNGMRFSEVMSKVRELDAAPPAGAPAFNIAFLRNITLDPVVPYLKYFCYRSGLKPEVYMAEYDVVMPEVINPDSGLFRSDPDLIVIALSLDTLGRPVSKCFASLDAARVKEESAHVLEFVDNVLTNIRKNSRAMILIHSFETPAYPAFGVLDTQAGEKQKSAIAELNAAIAGLAARAGGCFMVDIDMLIARMGEDRFIDRRMWHMGKIPFTRDAWRVIAAEYVKFIRASLGRNKKCLVLDCDNTLWGGIIGESGLEGIKIGGSHPGSCYRDFQSAVLNLYHRGVILAICSRNNESDVIEALDRHPEMVLRREHFASMRVNWNDKVSNIVEIAGELNIGLDSLVFVDDSEFEIGMVRERLPEVESILLTGEPSGYEGILASCGLFDTLKHTEEDRRRGEMYRAETERKKSRAVFSDLEGYFRSLEIQLTIARADVFSLPRIVQLIARTNQFNLTTRRHSESVVTSFSESDDHDVVYLSYKDRFGDMGIVGAAVIRYSGDEAEIDSFLLSCRALGRRVEDAFLSLCLKLCSERGAKSVTGLYAPTAKNSQVADFYPKRGFVEISREGGAAVFRVQLPQALFDPPDFFKIVTAGL